MFGKLLLYVLLVVGGYYLWNKYHVTKENLTPLQEVERCVKKGIIPASELAEISEKFPQLLVKELKDRKIKVSGILTKALVKGVGSHDLILDLEGTVQRKVSFSSDVGRFDRMNSGSVNKQYKYQKYGREIIVIQTEPSAKGGSSGNKANAPAPAPVRSVPGEPKVAYREQDLVELEGIFQHISPCAIHIEWRQPGRY